MGSYTFKWEHPAEEVYVTGTFDNWTKSVKLEKVDDIFQKTVELPETSQKIYYKFVVNNDWVVNESAPKEPDQEGNINNFLAPEQIISAVSAINTITPTSSTAAMAATQPLEPKVLSEKETPVETPAESKPAEEEVLNEKAAEPLELAPVENKAETPAEALDEPKATPSDIPGGFPITPAADLDKPIGINPLPASEGGVNPITLQPGEKIPESITAQGIDTHVKLDKESYEKADALPGVETELPPVSSNTIPESSLPIADVNTAVISSVAPTSTTAVLAAEVPLEKKVEAAPEVPEVVKESQEKANVEPEAATESKEVEEKAKVEEELKETVPPAAVTSDGSKETEKTEGVSEGGLAGIAATAGGAIIAAGLVAKETIGDTAAPTVQRVAEAIPDSVKESLPAPIQEALVTETKEVKKEEVSPAVTPEVKDSIAESGESPEAAANTEDVVDKHAVESELLEEVKPVPAESETKVSPEVPAEVKESIVDSGESPEAAANTEAVEDKKAVESELLKEVQPVAAESETKVSPEVPAEVKESITESGKSPEAAANTEAVEDKKAVESELLKEVKPVPAEPETKPEETKAPALETEAAKAEETKPVEPVTEAPKTEESKAVEPVTEAPKTEEAKTETPVAKTENDANGAENGSKAAENGDSAANGSSKEHKKKHRISAFFNKLKSKLN